MADQERAPLSVSFGDDLKVSVNLGCVISLRYYYNANMRFS